MDLASAREQVRNLEAALEQRARECAKALRDVSELTLAVATMAKERGGAGGVGGAHAQLVVARDEIRRAEERTRASDELIENLKTTVGDLRNELREKDKTERKLLDMADKGTSSEKALSEQNGMLKARLQEATKALTRERAERQKLLAISAALKSELDKVVGSSIATTRATAGTIGVGPENIVNGVYAPVPGDSHLAVRMPEPVTLDGPLGMNASTVTSGISPAGVAAAAASAQWQLEHNRAHAALREQSYEQHREELRRYGGDKAQDTLGAMEDDVHRRPRGQHGVVTKVSLEQQLQDALNKNRALHRQLLQSDRIDEAKPGQYEGLVEETVPGALAVVGTVAPMATRLLTKQKLSVAQEQMKSAIAGEAVPAAGFGGASSDVVGGDGRCARGGVAAAVKAMDMNAQAHYGPPTGAAIPSDMEAAEAKRTTTRKGGKTYGGTSQRGRRVTPLRELGRQKARMVERRSKVYR